MFGEAFNLRGVVSVDTGPAERGLSSLGEKVGGAGSMLASAFGTAAVAGIAAVGAGLASAVVSATGFETTMSGVKAVSGATSTEMAGLSALALQLGKDTSFSASEAGKGIEELVKGGLSIPDIMDGAAKATLNLAAAGGVSLPEAATIAANALAQFSLKGADMAHVSDLIAGAANASAIDVNDFKFSLSAAGAVAATLGFSFDDLAQGIAVMGQAGLKGSDAGTSLKTMMLNLDPSTKKAAEEMRALGIITADGSNRFFDATGKVKSMSEVAQILQDSMKGLTKEQQINALQTAFGTDAVRAAAIMAKAGAAGFDEMAASMGKVTAEAVGAEKLNNLSGSVEQLKGSVETLAITFGLHLTPLLKDATDGATGFVNSLIPLADEWGPKVADAWRTVGQVFKNDWSPSDSIDPVVNAVGKIAVVFRDDVIPAVRDFAMAAWPPIRDAFIWLKDVGGPAVWGAVKNIWQTFKDLNQALTDNGAYAMVSDGLKAIKDQAAPLWDGLKKLWSALAGDSGLTLTVKDFAAGMKLAALPVLNLVDAVGIMARVIVDGALSLLKINQGMEALKRGEFGKAADLFGAAKDAAADAFTAMGEGSERFQKRNTDAWLGVKADTKTGTDVVTTDTQTMQTDVTTAHTGMATDLGTITKGLWADQKTVWDGGKLDTTSTAYQLGVDLGKKWDEIKTNTGTTVGALQSDLVTKWGTIKSDVDTAMGREGAADSIVDITSVGWKAVGSIATRLLAGDTDSAKSIAAGAWGQIKTDLDRLMGKAGATDSIVDIANVGWGAIVGVTKALLAGDTESAQSISSGAWGQIKTDLDTIFGKGTGDTITGVVQTGWNAISTATDTIFGEGKGVRKLFSDAMGVMKAAVDPVIKILSGEDGNGGLIGFINTLVTIMPKWLIPHSPTPFQVGLEGITKAIHEMGSAWGGIKVPTGELVDLARRMAQEYNIPPDIFMRQITRESNFDPSAVSPAGAAGLGQFMPGTAAEIARALHMSIQELMGSPANQLRGAAYYDDMLREMFGGDLVRMLVGYNWGPGSARGWSGDLGDLPSETRQYLRDILGLAQGGIVMPRAGGVLANLAEDGRAEAVIPLPSDWIPGRPASSSTPMQTIRIVIEKPSGREAEEIYVTGREMAIRRGRVPSGGA